jgi:hypothetical protein
MRVRSIFVVLVTVVAGEKSGVVKAVKLLIKIHIAYWLPAIF